MKRAVLYLRVSTLDQTTANQERELRQVAERAGWQIVHVYKDHVSTPEQKCIGWPEQKYISEAGKKAPRTGALV